MTWAATRPRGGGHLAWRRLFRADGLTRLNEDDCAALTELGLATVIDLRTASEVNDRGRFPTETVEVEYHHLPLTDSIPGTEEVPDWGEADVRDGRTCHLLAEGESSIARAITLLASDGSLPAVFHCSAGKDRTGVLAAIVLGGLGVPDDVIVDDYALSAVGTSRLMQALREEYADAVEEVEKYATAILRVPPGSDGGIHRPREDRARWFRVARSAAWGERRDSCARARGGRDELTVRRRSYHSSLNTAQRSWSRQSPET